MTAFDGTTLDLLRETRQVRIETSRGPDAPLNSTIIWVVVDDLGRVLIRSVRGTRGRWYRDLVAHPAGAVSIRGERIGIRAEQAGDDSRIAAFDAAVMAKYGDTASTRSMLLDKTLHTTLELHPE